MKRVLITGAAGNLGTVAIQRFLAAGYHVIATVSPGKKWEGVLSSHVQLVEVDLAHEQSVQAIVQQLVATTKIDAALLLAGGYAGGTIYETSTADVQKMIDLNFNTAYTIATTLFAEMVKQKSGRIIFVGARPALVANQGKNAIAYGLSKAMVMKLAEYLNAEGADHNVLSHVIVPSTIDTAANRKAMPTSDFSTWVRPEDIADTMLFLCSDTSAAFRETVIKMYNRS